MQELEINIYGCNLILMLHGSGGGQRRYGVVDKTLNHNIEFMNKYAQYKFHYSSPQFYEWVKVISKYPISSAQERYLIKIYMIK